MSENNIVYNKVMEALDYYKALDYNKAEQLFKEAIKLDPNYIEHYYCLANLYSTIHNNYDTAIFYLKKALDVVPNYSAYKALAENYLLKNDY